MPFIHDDFLLTNRSARRLYREFAENEPILDYHSHLPPRDIAENRRFQNLFEIWLEGDHYKWRAMRAAGVDERFCTGDASPREKFMAWARTVPHTLRNPLYHWTHLELTRYFHIDELLDETTAPAIWDRANELLASEPFRVHGILDKFHVRALCTTDDPTDDLVHHQTIASSALGTRVFPTFRPDRALRVDQPTAFRAWLERLQAAADTHITRLADFLDALRKRHDFFHELGCRLSDHGLDHCYADFCSDTVAAAIFDELRAGQAVSPDQQSQWASFLMLFFGRLDAQRGWTKQLHLGALRNNCTRLLNQVGADLGCDSIGDWPQAQSLSRYLDRLDRDGALPRIIVYNSNPRDNYVLATMMGNFQDGKLAGKMQFGSGWWFLDQKEGMEWQLNALSQVGLLSRFVGMLTDSRSFLSFPRHEYFRRVLCNVLGADLENGHIPDRDDLVGPLIRNLCFANAREYLGLSVPA
jgi:glucuronate isomerase